MMDWKVNLNKADFLLANRANVEVLVKEANAFATKTHGTGQPLTVKEWGSIFYAEAAINRQGLVGAWGNHSWGEKGILPPPFNLSWWLGGYSMPNTNIHENLRLFSFYMACIKRIHFKTTRQGVHLFKGLFTDHISEKARCDQLGAVIHGYYLEGHPTYPRNNNLPTDQIKAAIDQDGFMTCAGLITNLGFVGADQLHQRKINMEIGWNLYEDQPSPHVPETRDNPVIAVTPVPAQTQPQPQLTRSERELEFTRASLVYIRDTADRLLERL